MWGGLAAGYTIYEIGEFYVLIFPNKVTIPHLCLNLKLGGLNFEDEVIWNNYRSGETIVEY